VTTASSSYCRFIHVSATTRERSRRSKVVVDPTLPPPPPPKILKIYEPDYLDHKGHRIPHHDLVNIRLQGYDFPVLEKFEAFVHRTAERIGLEVDDSWGIPAQKFRITKLKPETTLVDTEYQLNIYERTVQVADVPTTILPILVNIVQAALPVGVTMTVKEHEVADEEIRYIPDLELLELKEQLQLDGTALKKKVRRVKESSKFRRVAKQPKKDPLALL
jgi:large subunit ribosomal protein L48